MSILEIANLKFGYNEITLFNNLDMNLYREDHLGLIGINGVGKTTLLNIIAHRLDPDEGKVAWMNNVDFSYLDQHLKIYDTLTIKDYLYKVYEELFVKEKEMNDLYKSLESVAESEYDKILNKAYNIQNYLEQNGLYMIHSRISNVINGLGIDYDENWILKNLSSGQRGKVFLAKMLLEEKDVLLLDEPTNFLDAVHVEWLTKYLSTYAHAFIVISHNNDFLNGVCNVICALENKKIIRYRGNYDAYLLQKDMRDKQYQAEYNTQQRFIKKTQEFIDKNIVRASTTKRAQSRRKMLDKVEVLAKPENEKKVKFTFPFTHTFNSEAIIVKKLLIGYSKPILKEINIKLMFGEKVVITGKNGVGKTTFLKTILGQIPVLGGIVKIPDYNKIVYYSQEMTEKLDITPLEYIKDTYPKMEDKNVRSLLNRYGITSDLAVKPINKLSGGEISKVRFAKLNLEDSNLLILDEPTNHLDKIAKESLFASIENYPGTVILVSHEKEFYKKLKMKEIHFS
ncbi:MAG TPA: ABC-F family ATP-binding cassette domain-containing protein [Bacilli bacterium]|nr:ABC-F family ATP-binding cassette domain-containing protein [Bacilli bacterium]